MTVSSFWYSVYAIIPRPATISAVYLASVYKHSSLEGLTRLENESSLSRCPFEYEILFPAPLLSICAPQNGFNYITVPSHMILADFIILSRLKINQPKPSAFDIIEHFSSWFQLCWWHNWLESFQDLESHDTVL